MQHNPDRPPADEICVIESLVRVDAGEWNGLVADNPFLRHEFLHALHETGCASQRSGWQPHYLTLWRNGGLHGAMPLYVKSHSYGEYVFDWAWANAYAQSGLRYYPKLLCAVPFSPISGPRVLAIDDQVREALVTSALQTASEYSSLHVLFPPSAEAATLQRSGLQIRRGVQFHWNNPGYRDFEEYLGQLSSAKRKKIRQERRRVQEAGVTFRHRVGTEISESDWRFFSRCYEGTYHAHRSSPYLNLEFFQRIGDTMPENLFMVIAHYQGKPIAAALNVFSRHTLFGRYWGAIGHIPLLHFEACYYQAIDFCIERGIRVFEGGAQGEHKLARGFLPVETLSAHWLKHPEFSQAVQRFLDRESAGIDVYLDELSDRSPFRDGSTRN